MDCYYSQDTKLYFPNNEKHNACKKLKVSSSKLLALLLKEEFAYKNSDFECFSARWAIDCACVLCHEKAGHILSCMQQQRKCWRQ